MDSFTGLVNTITILVYGTICVVSLIFTFFLDLYYAIDQALKINVISARAITPLESNIYIIDSWLISHNRSVGPLLVVLSLIDLKLSLDIIRQIIA